MRKPGLFPVFPVPRLGFFCGFLCPLLCASFRAQQTNDAITIVGQLRVTRLGPPPIRVLVKLERSGAQVGETYSDAEGKFSFEDVPPNLYRIVVRQEGYRAVDEAVSINGSVQHSVYVRVELVPEDKTGNPSQATMNGGNPSLVDESALADKISKQAKKEDEKGRKAEREGKPQEAIGHYQKALAIAPTMYFARNNLGSQYVEKQRFAEAETEFRKVISENPADANAYFNLANVYLLTSRLNEASDSIEDGLKRQPQSAFGELLMGSVLIRRGNA